MRQFFTAAAAAAFLAVAPAPYAAAQDVASGAYKMDPTHATMTWSVVHIGLSHYTASLDRFDIELTIDAEDVSKTSVRATLDPTSIRTNFPGEKDFNGEISNDPRFLNAGEHPEITFVSTGVEKTGDNTATLTGDLTMLGQTQEVTMDVTLTGAIAEHPFAKKPAVGFQASGVIDRTAFGMEFLAPAVVSPEVKFEINAEFIQQ